MPIHSVPLERYHPSYLFRPEFAPPLLTPRLMGLHPAPGIWLCSFLGVAMHRARPYGVYDIPH